MCVCINFSFVSLLCVGCGCLVFCVASQLEQNSSMFSGCQQKKKNSTKLFEIVQTELCSQMCALMVWVQWLIGPSARKIGFTFFFFIDYLAILINRTLSLEAHNLQCNVAIKFIQTHYRRSPEVLPTINKNIIFSPHFSIGPFWVCCHNKSVTSIIAVSPWVGSSATRFNDSLLAWRQMNIFQKLFSTSVQRALAPDHYFVETIWFSFASCLSIFGSCRHFRT